MSTSVQVAYDDPQRTYTFSRNACFGDMNRLSGRHTNRMEVMEWHPEDAGSVNVRDAYQTCTPRKAMQFVNSFGMWENLYWLTSMNTVACNLANTPADAMITGFMTMRDYQQCSNTRLFDHFELDHKIEFALWCAGVYRDRYGNGTLGIQPPSHGEGGVCYVDNNGDAIALYLLVFGTKEDFNGCWAQGAIGRTPATEHGYVRNSSDSSRIRSIRANNRSTWGGLACWLRSWLQQRPEHLSARMGRLTVRQFYDRLQSRLQALNGGTRQQQAETITDAFNELRDFYS